MTKIFCLAFFFTIIVHFSSCAVLEGLFNEATSCEIECEQNFSSSPDFKKSCAEGCRLYTIINLAKDVKDSNKTVKLCESACFEAFVNESAAKACSYGCNAYPKSKSNDDDLQTLHLLTPFIYMKTAYNSMAHHVKQFISTSWTVYIQEDSGKMVVLQSSPKVIESLEYSVSRDDTDGLKGFQQEWQEDKRDWMDCISHQSGIPRWLLVVVLFGFIFALLWLCCATAVTAPSHPVSAPKKKEVGYLLLHDPCSDMKIPLIPTLEHIGTEAPPLPKKSPLV